jgi:hypothetical protein
VFVLYGSAHGVDFGLEGVGNGVVVVYKIAFINFKQIILYVLGVGVGVDG